jgi:hypothetical protein
LAQDGGEWSASCPSHFIPWVKSPQYPLDRRLGGPQSWFGHGKRKIKAPKAMAADSLSVTLNETGIPYTLKYKQQNSTSHTLSKLLNVSGVWLIHFCKGLKYQMLSKSIRQTDPHIHIQTNEAMFIGTNTL